MDGREGRRLGFGSGCSNLRHGLNVVQAFVLFSMSNQDSYQCRAGGGKMKGSSLQEVRSGIQHRPLPTYRHMARLFSQAIESLPTLRL